MLDLGFQQSTLQSQGFPILSESEQLTCGNTRQCDRAGKCLRRAHSNPLWLTAVRFQNSLTEYSKDVSRPRACMFTPGLTKRYRTSGPLAATSHTPLYSNSGFQILGYALESMLDASYEDILVDRLIKPLNLTRSSLHAPDPELAAIPYNETFSFFNYDMGDEGRHVQMKWLMLKYPANNLPVPGESSHPQTTWQHSVVQFSPIP